jgi:SAM-dependent methyltransferase
VAWLVVHLVERPAAFAEMARVLEPGGVLAIATFDPTHFDRYYLNRLFPSLEAIDRARFPEPDALVAELEAAGFEPRLLRLSQQGELARDESLQRIRGRFISTLRLLDEAEYQQGLARAERELPERVRYALEWTIAVAARA